MDGKPTRGWYVTRIELAIGISAAGVSALGLLAAPAYMGYERLWWETPLTVAGIVGTLVGLAWMIRIYRGPRDEPPSWRYRDR